MRGDKRRHGDKDKKSEWHHLACLVPIYSNHIMFAYDLCHSQIEYFREFFKLLKDVSKK